VTVDDPTTPPARTRRLPRWLRVVLLLVLIAVAIVVLFTTVFPWVERQLEDPTMGAPAEVEVAAPAPAYSLRSPR